MTQPPCPTCPTLRAEVAQLQIEVAMLLRIIQDARNECATLAGEADKTLAKRSGVAPRVWGDAKGQKKAAGRVLERLQ